MKVEKLENNIRPLATDVVRVKRMGYTVEIMWTNKQKTQIGIQKLDKDTYMDLETGEVKEFVKKTTRAGDVNNVRVSLNNLRDLISTNVLSPSSCRWVTLTYAENMTDSSKLKDDFKNFNTRCREIFGDYRYIAVREPQGRGAWHLHVILIFDGFAPFMKNEIVADCWKKGFVTVRQMTDTTFMGAYLTAYLADMELEEFMDSGADLSVLQGETIKEIETIEDGKTQTKRYIKGARLHLYPSGMNIYSCSKGIKKPSVERMDEFKTKKLVSDGTLTFERTNIIKFDDDKQNKIINYRYYTINNIDLQVDK